MDSSMLSLFSKEAAASRSSVSGPSRRLNHKENRTSQVVEDLGQEIHTGGSNEGCISKRWIVCI
jgi:hypothetical protein